MSRVETSPTIEAYTAITDRRNFSLLDQAFWIKGPSAIPRAMTKKLAQR